MSNLFTSSGKINIQNDKTILKNNTILEHSNVIGATTGFNPKIMPKNNYLIDKLNENPDLRFNRGIIPANPNSVFFKQISIPALISSEISFKNIVNPRVNAYFKKYKSPITDPQYPVSAALMYMSGGSPNVASNIINLTTKQN
jgi:hypothetical protein